MEHQPASQGSGERQRHRDDDRHDDGPPPLPPRRLWSGWWLWSDIRHLAPSGRCHAPHQANMTCPSALMCPSAICATMSTLPLRLTVPVAATSRVLSKAIIGSLLTNGPQDRTVSLEAVSYTHLTLPTIY